MSTDPASENMILHDGCWLYAQIFASLKLDSTYAIVPVQYARIHRAKNSWPVALILCTYASSHWIGAANTTVDLATHTLFRQQLSLTSIIIVYATYYNKDGELQTFYLFRGTVGSFGMLAVLSALSTSITYKLVCLPATAILQVLGRGSLWYYTTSALNGGKAYSQLFKRLQYIILGQIQLLNPTRKYQNVSDAIKSKLSNSIKLYDILNAVFVTMMTVALPPSLRNVGFSLLNYILDTGLRFKLPTKAPAVENIVQTAIADMITLLVLTMTAGTMLLAILRLTSDVFRGLMIVPVPLSTINASSDMQKNLCKVTILPSCNVLEKTVPKLTPPTQAINVIASYDAAIRKPDQIVLQCRHLLGNLAYSRAESPDANYATYPTSVTKSPLRRKQVQVPVWLSSLYTKAAAAENSDAKSYLLQYAKLFYANAYTTSGSVMLSGPVVDMNIEFDNYIGKLVQVNKASWIPGLLLNYLGVVLSVIILYVSSANSEANSSFRYTAKLLVVDRNDSDIIENVKYEIYLKGLQS